jgi:hypothetical protein
MVKALPAYLDGEVRLFNFAEDGMESDSLEWFFAIQGELMEEWSENERNGVPTKALSTTRASSWRRLSKAICGVYACPRRNRCTTTSRPTTRTS